MKKLLLSLIFTLPTATVVPAQAQYVGPACVDIRQVNLPGGYDGAGNYYPPTTRAVQTTVPCNYGLNNQYYYNQGYNQNYYRTCNPNAGAAMGAGLAGALSGGTGYNYNNSWSNNYSRGSSSGSYSSSYRSNDSWALFGAGLGALMFSC
jgi:hypothetical protein